MGMLQLDFDPDAIIRLDDLQEVYRMVHQVEMVKRSLSREVVVPERDRVQDTKLPRLELPTFDGELRQWPMFKEIFERVIHQNPSLTDDQKVQYLVGKLKGRALQTVANFPVTASNYQAIWTKICDKYHDEFRLAKYYFNEMFSFKTLSNESANGLEYFLERFATAYEGLKILNICNLADFLVFQLATTKIDPETLRNFEMHVREVKIPTFEHLTTFIRQQISILEQPRRFPISKSVPKNHSENKSHSFIVNKTQCASFTDKCSCCNIEKHPLYKCTEFLNLLPKERFELVKEQRRCFNCLNQNHMIRECKSTSSCNICKKKHHSLLHLKKSEDEEDQSKLLSQSNTVTLHNKNTINSADSKETVLLSTAQVLVRTPNSQLIRIILDSASQSNLITEKCVRSLGLSKQNVCSAIYGLGDAQQKVLGKTNLKFSPHFDRNQIFSADMVIVHKISEKLPSVQINCNVKKSLINFRLADEKFDTPGEVDAIIGAELYPVLLKEAKVMVPDTSCCVLDTKLGFVVMGKVSAEETEKSLCSFFIKEESLESLVKKFWEIENFDKEKLLSKEESLCEEMFIKGLSRDEEGRFIVKLPFREPPSCLGNSEKLAKIRYLNLEKRFNQNLEFKNSYAKVIQEFLDKKYLSSCKTNIPDEGYYVPHHGVYKKESTTTPLRIVFDASAVTSSGKSLNDLLYTGEKLHSDPIEILINFRLFKTAVTADIRQMYMQIRLHPDHCKYQKLFWRFDPRSEIKVYELNRIAFGLRSSPFLALRVVRKLIEEEARNYPLACEHIPHNMYVDDFISSVVNPQKAVKVYQELVQLFKKGGFTLGKWTTNSRELLNEIPQNLVETNNFEFNYSSTTKVLGLRWDPQKDNFYFSCTAPALIPTKRNILSFIARLFDPLGFIGPLILTAKLLIKQLWKEKLDWDDTPSENVLKLWDKFSLDFKLISELKIPRHVCIIENSIVDLVGFCDGSESAYGAVIYIRCNNSEQISSFLLCSKSRVTPMKGITLPRIELCSAVLLSKLLKCVYNYMSKRLKINRIFALSDSQITLSWIDSDPDRWQTFVAHRVTQVQNNISLESWYHVSSKNNPADITSRGAVAKNLVDNPFWWNGPDWIVKPYSSWPISRKVSLNNLEVTDELRNKRVTLITTLKEENIVGLLSQRISSWPKLLKVFCYILRFGRILDTQSEVITVKNLNIAEQYTLKYIQKIYFKEDIKLIAEGKLHESRLKKLSPFLDNGVLRVGGRLKYADVSYNHKHPILLPKDCPIVNMLIEYYHKLYLHPGTTVMISLLRQKYWIINIRSLVKGCISKCINCFRINPKTIQPIMSDLPKCRVTDTRPFTHTGVDYAGPFSITLKRARGQRTQKAYLCLFVCMATKALHLEVANDLSTAAFINAFKRFIARRGSCEVMYSDQGTNFIGARGVLNEVKSTLKSKEFSQPLNEFFIDKRIEWRFNPPSTPHFGGLWESLVKSVKRHLYKTIGNQILTLDEFTTIIIQIEAIMNSRPLTNLNEDPSDPSPLTPNHFLLAKPIVMLPTTSSNSNMDIGRVQLLENLIKGYWKRWRAEYLHELQIRQKWNSPQNPVKEGQVVLIKDENAPPLRWTLGVIETLYPAKDGVIRVVDVRTSKGSYTRPVVKLCPLPIT